VRIAERIEQVIKMKKIEGPTTGFETMTRDELEDGSQVRNLSYMVQPNLIVASFAQVSLSKIDIPLSLEYVYQHMLDSR
jgi:hypothetical protein